MTYQNKYLKYKSKYLNQTKDYYLNGGYPMSSSPIGMYNKMIHAITGDRKPYNIEKEKINLNEKLNEAKKGTNFYSDMKKILDSADSRLLDNEQTVLMLLDFYSYNFENASLRLKNNKETVLKAIKKKKKSFQFAGTEMKKDIDVILEAVSDFPINFIYIDSDLKENKDVVMKIIAAENDTFRYANQTIRSSKEIILPLVKNKGILLAYVDNKFGAKDDEEIALAAIKSNIISFKYIGDKLKNNLYFMIDILDIIDIEEYSKIENDVSNLIKANLEFNIRLDWLLSNNKNYMLNIIKNKGIEQFKHTGPLLIDDLNFMIDILNIIDIKDYYLIENIISDKIKDDKKFQSHLTNLRNKL